MTNYIKKMVLMALFVVLGAFSMLSLGIIRVHADYDYYALHNLIVNGQFDDNITPWAAFSSTSIYDAETLKNTGSGTFLNAYTYEPLSVISGHKYYISMDYWIGNTVCNEFRIYLSDHNAGLGNIGNSVFSDYTTGAFWQTGSVIITSTSTTAHGSPTAVQMYDNSAEQSGKNMWLDNVIFIDLTETFGSGNEPSISDFETYYLPDEWFQDYDSYTPIIYDSITGTDLGNDDTLIDWNTALIGKNGGNITLDVYMYLDYLDDAEFDYSIYDVYVFYYGLQYNLHWIQDETDIHLYILDLSDDLEYSRLLAVLFDRSFSADNYASFRVVSGNSADQEPEYWLEIKTNFVYNVNIGGVAISTSQTNENESCPIIGVWGKFYDNTGSLIYPSLLLIGTGEDHISTLYDTFAGKYNNIQSFRLAFQMPGPDYYDEYPYWQNIHEITVFATDVVILVNPPIDDVIDLFPITVVPWYDFAGQMKNLFNEVAGRAYTFLHIAEITATLQTFFDAVDSLIYFLPPTVQYLALMVLAMGGLGVIIVIADKHL